MTSETLPLALGAMYLGTRFDDAASFALLDRFVDQGGTWIDTADCYSFWTSDTGAGGQSEETIGRWLAARPGMRDRVRIGTKVGAEPKVPGQFEVSQGLAPQTVRDGIEGSLRRLGVDHVDLYWAHKQDPTTDYAETIGTFDRIAQDGLATRIGISNHPVWLVERAQHLSSTPITAIQQRTSYLHHRPDIEVDGEDHEFGMMTPETIDYARHRPDVELWGYTVMLQGAYDRDDRDPGEAYDHPGSVRRLAALTSVAADLGVPRSQVVLAWLAGGSPSIIPILGGSSSEQLDSALAGVRIVLDDEHRARLDTAG